MCRAFARHIKTALRQFKKRALDFFLVLLSAGLTIDFAESIDRRAIDSFAQGIDHREVPLASDTELILERSHLCRGIAIRRHARFAKLFEAALQSLVEIFFLCQC